MNYSEAIELLGITTCKTLKENASLAVLRMTHLAPGVPLRYKVACEIIIKAAESETHGIDRNGNVFEYAAPMEPLNP